MNDIKCSLRSLSYLILKTIDSSLLSYLEILFTYDSLGIFGFPFHSSNVLLVIISFWEL